MSETAENEAKTTERISSNVLFYFQDILFFIVIEASKKPGNIFIYEAGIREICVFLSLKNDSNR